MLETKDVAEKKSKRRGDGCEILLMKEQELRGSWMLERYTGMQEWMDGEREGGRVGT